LKNTQRQTGRHISHL